MTAVQKYDVIIIGAGIGGLMTAYKLKNEDKNLKVLILDKGNDLHKRICPAQSGKPCVHCKTCAITSGFAGAGAFSDGKFNLGTAYGGTLGEELGEQEAHRYICEVDDILVKCSVSAKDNDGSEKVAKVYYSNDDLKLKCLQNNLQLLDMNVRHWGTDKNLIVMNELIMKLLVMGVELRSNSTVDDVVPYSQYEGRYIVGIKETNERLLTDNVVFAVGRGGTKYFSEFCAENGIPMTSNAVDIGVRVEMKDAVWKEFSDKIYEPKIVCRTKTFEDKTRMFCFNKGGIVSAENNNGIITANGHAYSDSSKRTDNCNFAILSSIHFTEPFDEPTVYAQNISSLANMIGNGNVIVQRFGDLIRGRRTNEHRLLQSTVKPTLKATPGDISLVLPHRILTNIIDTIYALDKVAPGTANDDTLLYACESKYYSVRPKMDKDFSLMPGIYAVGDCSGICRGLSQSGAMGLYVAERIIHNEK